LEGAFSLMNSKGAVKMNQRDDKGKYKHVHCPTLEGYMDVAIL